MGPAPISPNIFIKCPLLELKLKNTRDPLAARAKTLKGFSAVVKKPTHQTG